MRTEVPFTLPRGYVDPAGKVHREGVMRLATARDEIEPLRNAEVRANEAYLSVLLLSRTIVRLGELANVTPEQVESMFAVDFDHLQRLYERLYERLCMALQRLYERLCNGFINCLLV